MKRKLFTILTLVTMLMVSTSMVVMASNDFYDRVPYRGAFGMTNWTEGWTALWQYGFLNETQIGSGSEIVVTDDDIGPGEMVYWTADNTYILDGFVFVEDGAVLNIEAGTVIKGKPGQAESASAMIIARGGKIYAEGTAQKPIIFTAESDDVTDPFDIPVGTTNLWGGVILLGKAKTNLAAGQGQIEGIPPTDPRGAYGGDDDEDNSGVLRYVSIRHGGTDIGEGNEINGLTMGGVGSKTTIEFVEVFNNNDDGFEWFGGTVNCKYLISAFNVDDAFDHDEGFRGKLQFLFVIQSEDDGNRCGEHDGGREPEDGLPYSHPVIFNATFLGSGMNSTNPENDHLFKIRDNWGGEYYNSVFGDYAGDAMDVEDLDSGADSRERLETGDIVFKNNLWFDFGQGSSWDVLGKHEWETTYLSNAANGNEIISPQLKSISRTTDGGLDPRPEFGGPAWMFDICDVHPEICELVKDDFFEFVPYKGAFGSTNWAEGWTALSAYGFFTETVVGSGSEITVTDDDIAPGETYQWTADNTYILDGFVFVEQGAVLNIEAGTVIKGKPGQAESASALIIARGGKIFAEGTGTKPIIFTGESDDVSDPFDIPVGTTNLWGGLIVLGKAEVNLAAGQGQIEGIPPTDPRGAYGGSDDYDCSGALHFVSIRHGGTDIGEGNEINGLTMGAVGLGTTIDHIEVFNNNDDGFEWFGGKVNCKYLISALNVDDAFDHDEGIRGKQQFLFVIQSESDGNRAGEHDGGREPEDGLPFAHPVIYNATYLGSGINSTNPENDHLFKLRDNWGGEYINSIFGDYAGDAMDVEDLDSGADSRERLETGDIVFLNNIWFDFGAGSSWDVLGTHDWETTYLSDAANGNEIVDPQVAGISRATDGGLDPRPATDGAAYQNLAEISTTVKYIKHNRIIPQDYTLFQNYPNPFNPVTSIRFDLPVRNQVKLTVYNLMGQAVETLVDNKLQAGIHTIQWDASNMPSGVYFYRLDVGSIVISRKLTLIK